MLKVRLVLNVKKGVHFSIIPGKVTDCIVVLVQNDYSLTNTFERLN